MDQDKVHNKVFKCLAKISVNTKLGPLFRRFYWDHFWHKRHE